MDRRPDTPFLTREESGVPCLNRLRGLTPLLKLHRNPEIPAATEEEHWVSRLNLRWGPIPCSDSRSIPHSSSQLGWRLDSLYATPEVPRDIRHNLRGPPSSCGDPLLLVPKVYFGLFLESSVDISWRTGGWSLNGEFILVPHSSFQSINWIRSRIQICSFIWYLFNMYLEHALS